MDSKITIIKKNCKGCGEEYESRHAEVMGIKIEFGKGYCPECSEKRLQEQEKIDAQNKAREYQLKREQWRRDCGIPLRYLNSRFDGFNLNVDKSIINAFKMCQDYADKFSFVNPQIAKSLVLYSDGVWGIGKTFLVCSLAHRILDKWQGEVEYCPVYFISEPQLFMRIRATYNHPNDGQYYETEDTIYKKLTTVPLLILDDVGKEEVSDPRFVQRVLFAVIDGRYQKMLPIVMTANLDVNGLDRHFGGDRGNSASIDRLAEMTGNIFKEMTGKTYRDAKNRLPDKRP